MRVFTFSMRALALAAVAMFVSGCSKPAASDSAPAGGAATAEDGRNHTEGDGHDHSGHDHGGGDHSGHDHSQEHQGPHNGHVIELGRNHMYHAEVVEDDAAAMVTVYILDKDMKELAIDQASIVMNLKFDGEGQSFELTAAAGSTSQFNAADKTLFEALHEHEATGKLRVTIDGSPYTGDVEHHHHGDDDDGHDHKDGHEH